MNGFLGGWSPRILSLLRIITGFLILWHGAQKLFGFPQPMPPGAGGALAIFGGILEFFGGLLFLFGLFTRPTAFILSGMMAVAYFMAHAPGGFLPFLNGGELAVIYCFVFFYFTFAGGGSLSIDSILGSGRGAAQTETA